MKRDYKLYMDFGTSLNNVWDNPKGFFYFTKNGATISTAAAAQYYYITGDTRYFRLDRSTLGIKSINTYLKSAKDYDVSENQEFTFSFFYKIPRDVLNEMTIRNFPIEGFKWDGGKITLYSKASAAAANTYKGRYIHIECCGITEDLIYDYQSYAGEDYIHMAITMKDNILRMFMNGILVREAATSSPNYHFNNLLVGNFTTTSSGFDNTKLPVIIFDELCICDRCFWTTSFRVPTRPLLYLFPEVIDEEVNTTIPTLKNKINSAPNFYSKYKSFWDADLDRAEIVRPDAYRPSLFWKPDMYNKHKFNQDDYDYTAKSNWEYLYTHKTWPYVKPYK